MGMAMSIKSPVIVMALYDIGRDVWNNFTVSYDTYLYWMRNTLSIDANIVIYTENKFVNKIKEYRKEFDPKLEKTIIIEQPMETLDCYQKYYKDLSKLMSSEIFKQKAHHDVPEMTKPLYNIIMFNKIYFLKHAKDSGYFDGDFFIWADAGGLREDVSEYRNLVWPSLEKLNSPQVSEKITFFTHSKNIQIDNKESHALSQMRYIQGTCFFIPKHMIDEFATDCDNTIIECMNNNYIGSDEKIFDITYLKNSNKYNLIQCTWRTYYKLFKDKTINKKVFIDLGSHNCQSIEHFINNELHLDNEWEIHAFEPNPLVDTQKYAEKLLTNIKVHKKAAWIRDADTIMFNQYGKDGTSQGSLVADSGGGKNYSDFYHSTYVPSVDILKFINSFNKNLDIYLKIDIEFSEYIIIDYMLKSGWPKNIKKVWIAWHDSDNEINKFKMKYFISKIQQNNTEVADWL